MTARSDDPVTGPQVGYPRSRVPAKRVDRSSPRVAWVAEIPAPYRVGLYRRLREEAGIDLKLLFCSATQADRDWTVSLEGVPHVVMRGHTLRVRPREQFFLRVNPQVWRELDRFNPHVVVVGGYAHVTMQLAMLWCRRTGTPYLINSESHQQGTKEAEKGRGRWRGSVAAAGRPLVNAVKRFFIRGAAAGLPAGTLARDCLVSYGGPAERMFALPNTCDVERFARESERSRNRRAELRMELGLGSGPVVLYVGRLAPVKGLDTLLQAFAALQRSCAGTRASRLTPGPERRWVRTSERLSPIAPGWRRCAAGAIRGAGRGAGSEGASLLRRSAAVGRAALAVRPGGPVRATLDVRAVGSGGQ
jgi:glycosyltransferase involved in cell wall biosynthesis